MCSTEACEDLFLLYNVPYHILNPLPVEHSPPFKISLLKTLLFVVPSLVLGGCRNSFFVFVSDRSRSGLAENLGQIRFS